MVLPKLDPLGKTTLSEEHLLNQVFKLQEMEGPDSTVNRKAVQVLTSEYQKLVRQISAEAQDQQKLTEIMMEIFQILVNFAFFPLQGKFILVKFNVNNLKTKMVFKVT